MIISEAQCTAMAVRLLLSLVLPPSLPKVNFCVGMGRLIEFEFLFGTVCPDRWKTSSYLPAGAGKGIFFVFLAGGVGGCPSLNFSAQVAGSIPSLVSLLKAAGTVHGRSHLPFGPVWGTPWKHGLLGFS